MLSRLAGYAARSRAMGAMMRGDGLDEIFSDRQVAALFQPIVACDDGELWGHEALIRGPSASALHSPLKLFDAAARDGRLVELDLLCRAVIIEAFGRSGCPGRLFLNVTPDAVVDVRHPSGETLRLLERVGVAPERVVIEITEQFPIHDYDIVRRAVDHYRAMGFAIALDDLGAGYAGLRHWSELRPDYVKLDRYFASGADADAGKRDVVRSVMDMARRMGARVIVEGIETDAEYLALRALGMRYCQGYLLGRPRPRPLITGPALPGVAHTSDRDGRHTAGDLAAPVMPSSPAATAAEVAARFRAEPHLRCVPLVSANERPAGLVRGDALLSRLAHNYGHALFGGRPVAEFVDTRALTVPADLPLEALSRRVTETADTDEVFVVTDAHGRYVGVGSVFDLLRRITDLQIHTARHANPLTGLPGNVRIEQHVDERIAAGEAFVVVYADLDNFKPYNDRYGYQRGDEVILATARVLEARLRADEFAGHVGGDDFVLVLSGSDWERRCRKMLDEFAARSGDFHEPGDHARDGLDCVDRHGPRRRLPLVALSLAAVPVTAGRFANHHEISARLAGVKREAKAKAGNVLFVDRHLAPAEAAED